MIPLHLTISGFLSYRDPVELDFTGFDLACIAGPNGAGKSSLLDAITWALFGQARKRDDSLINSHPEVKTAAVSFVFAYEGNLYRVQRSLSRGKSTLLEFQILQDDGLKTSDESQISPSFDNRLSSNWKPLTERTLRDTQDRIISTLRMDYETFVNASFFLQGKADQFTQQRPGDRKRILGSILGLEIWETYRQRSAERRKAVEAEIGALDGRLQEINAELGEEQTRKAHLDELLKGLETLSRLRIGQESVLENYRKTAAELEEKRKRVTDLDLQLEKAGQVLQELESRLQTRQDERQTHDRLLGRAGEIRQAYANWQAARLELERWEQDAARFREQEKRRQAPLDEINVERARLTQEQQSLQNQAEQLTQAEAEIPTLEKQIETAGNSLRQAEEQLNRRNQLQGELSGAHQRQAEANAENPRLKAEMEELKARIDQLKVTEGANCPLCGQPLSSADRKRLVQELDTRGQELGDRYRANLVLARETDQQVRDLETGIASLAQAESDFLAYSRAQDQFNNQIEQIKGRRADWKKDGLPQLKKITKLLDKETFCPEARLRLKEIDAELKDTGYDAAGHDDARQREAQGRPVEADYLALEKAQAALVPLEREIKEIELQVTAARLEIERQQKEYDQAAATLSAAEVQAPDIPSAERELLNLQEQENQRRLEVGAARQKVDILEDLKVRRKDIDEQRQERARLVSQFKQLEQAFGKDGVPALLIEQALPQIEARANEVLDRLSAGNMSVRFITQAQYKDKNRDDLRETLDIQISDSAGARDYEMFSGGEAFRVNFAIRLALSEVLAQRAGARLQTLVIDEGFGSQDAEGRQRLIETINLVRQDFSKILVITHIDELKDAFPTRIEVEKTGRGSSVRVV